MTAEQLEELLGKVTQGDWRAIKWGGDEWPEKRWSVSTGEGCAVCVSPRYADHTDLTDASLIALSPSLARRVIAAEKLVEAGSELQRLWSIDKGGRDLSWRVSLEGSMEDHECALAAYREASK